MKKNRITKDIIPNDFTLSLALVDLIPVLFFSIAMSLVGFLLKNYLFFLGVIICFISATIKVLWKIIVVNEKRNIWWMFIQMRIALPSGLVLMIIAFSITCFTRDMSAFWYCFNNITSLFFISVGVLGMFAMIFFSFFFDSSDSTSNWIEQITNSIAQFAFFLACLFAFII